MGSADAYGVDDEPILRSCFGGDERVAREILAVGEEHEHLLVLVVQERFSRRFDRARDVRPAERDHARVERVEGLLEDGVVERERRLEKRAPGERDEADAILGKLSDEIANGELRALEPIGLHVGREHALRRIHGEEDVHAAPVSLFPSISELRTRERDRSEHDAAHDHGFFEASPNRRHRRSQIGQEMLRAELRERASP